MAIHSAARLSHASARGILACALLLMILSGSAMAQTYSCGTPTSGHCYGVAGWQEQPEYFGAYSDIMQVTMGCPSGCGGFVDNEIWLIDTKTGGCTSNGFGMCWVEAGYFFEDGSGHAQFFWADARPMTSNTFNLHILGSTDPVGTTNHFMIVKDGRGAAGVFQVWVYSDGLSTLYQGTSTNNAMRADRIDVGQELAGTSGAFAGRASIARNIWAVRALGPDFVFQYSPQTNTGGVTSGNPPFASWAVDPASPGPEGGLLTTRCCRPLSTTPPPPPRPCADTEQCCGRVVAGGACAGQCVPTGSHCQ